jgi:DNA-binding LacI/PurR family transcriptional regulator
MNELRKIERLSTSARGVLEQIRAWIVEHHLEPGSRLPSERDLAERLQVSQRQIRSALELLQADGLIVKVSERIRAVATDWQEERSLFANTVVLVSTVQFSTLATERDPSNMTEATFLGAANAIQTAKLNFIALHPSQLSSAQAAALIRERPLGVIVTEDAVPAIIPLAPRLAAAGIPVAAHGDTLTEAELAQATFDTVHSDHSAGARALCRFLHERGCRRIGTCWPFSLFEAPRRHWVASRLAGYQAGCRELGLEPLPPVLTMPVTASPAADPAAWFEVRVQAAAGFLVSRLQDTPAPLDGLLLVNDADYFPMAAACRRLGREPGRDVRLVGYDNFHRVCPDLAFEPGRPLATVDKRDAALGQALFALLQARVAKALPDTPQRRVLSPELVDLHP